MAMKKLRSAHSRAGICEKLVFNHAMFNHSHIPQITVDGCYTCLVFILAKSGNNKVYQWSR